MRISDWSSDVCSSDLIAMALTRLSLTVNNNTENHHFTARLTGALSRLQGQRKRSSTGFLHFPPRPCEAINVDNRQLYFLALSRASAFARGFKGLARKSGGGFHRDITDTSRTNEERNDGSSRRQSGR